MTGTERAYRHRTKVGGGAVWLPEAVYARLLAIRDRDRDAGLAAVVRRLVEHCEGAGM